MTRVTVPLVVVEGGPARVDEACDDLAVVGWEVVDRTSATRPGTAVVLAVRTAEDVPVAVLAALRGRALVVDASGAPAEAVDVLCDDLRRLGHLDHRTGAVGLDREQRRLLDLLASGVSLGEAARRLHLSRRSADRRLARARDVLGAASTTQALAARRRHLRRLPAPDKTGG